MIQSRVRFAQSTNDLESCRHTGDAIEPPAGLYDIAVRSDRNHAKCGMSALDPADEIAGRIDPRGKTGFNEPLVAARLEILETAQ
jgi:hypothetical protein